LALARDHRETQKGRASARPNPGRGIHQAVHRATVRIPRQHDETRAPPPLIAPGACST